MKILLSAYACEPNRGSEPGIGWNWALALSRKGHEIWVITRANNMQAIEADPASKDLNFEYVELPLWMRWWKKGNRGIQFYYLLWQIFAVIKAKRLTETVSFDLVQHVSFVSVRQPSFMGNLGLPFIFGPVAGGESAPLALRKSYPFKGMLWDGLRDIMNYMIRWDPLMLHTFSKAQWIIVTSEQTRILIPRSFHHKTLIHLAIGISVEQNGKVLNGGSQRPLNVLFVGNLLYLKGIHLALKAFSRFHSHMPGSCFTIVGDGSEAAWLKKIIVREALPESAVRWIPRIEQKELMSVYPTHDVFVFPSLHDSGGMVVLEAMSQGLPVIALDIGGPKALVDSTCGYSIRTGRQKEEDVIESIYLALRELQDNPSILHEKSMGALRRAESFTWDRQVQALYNKVVS